MKISETQVTSHQLLCILYKGLDNKDHETHVDICWLNAPLRTNPDAKELVSVTIGCKEITAFDLEILKFLKKEVRI